MANFRDDFFAALDAGNRWSVPVAINRNNPLPLDDNSVFRTEAELDAYIAGPLVYPGQVIALVEANKTTIYYIDQEGAKQEVGASLSADGKTVIINNGNITLANIPTDTTKTYNATLVNGVLTWTEPSATTVEGLDTRLTAAEGQINTLNTQVAELGKAFEFKGTAGSISADGKTIYDAEGKAIEGISIGDVYQINDKEYAYNGEVWVELGFNVDLSGYATDEELAATDAKAVAAGNAASAAQNTANEAKTAAGNAQSAAEAAQTTANQAVQDAAAADTKAQTAISNAATAQSKADEAFNKATTNTTSIGSLRDDLTTEQGKITNLQSIVGEHTTKITDLEAFQTEHTALYTALNGTVTTHGTDIATLKEQKANVTELNAAIADITKNTTAITTLNETTIPGINEEIGKKADASVLDNYYTKAQIGTIEDNKTLIDMIVEAADTSALEARVKANEDAIKAIDFVDNNELAAAIKVETDRAVAKENELAGLIAGNTAVINTMLGNEDEIDLNSIAELAAWITEHGAEAEGMTTAIKKNADDIAALTTTVNDNKTATDNAIKAITDNYKVKDVDGTTLELDESGKASIKSVSTDLLAQGKEELIFCAGDAGKKEEAAE